MHIAEGILTGQSMAATTLAGGAALAWGTVAMGRFTRNEPMRKPLLAMAGAFIFFVSLIPLPAFTGTTSHPCGTPLAGILMGPACATALAALALFLQAAFFAHGGFSSLGANTLVLGLAGAGTAWLAFRAGRRLGLPLWAAAGLGGLVGDVCTYLTAGLILGGHLAFFAPEPKYSFGGYLAVIYGSYLPTQGPIAIAEMIVTAYAVQSIGRMRPEVLEDLGVVRKGELKGAGTAALLLMIGLGLAATLRAVEPLPASKPTAMPAAEAPATGFPGMDEAVNEKVALDAGARPRDPYINTEAMGDLWNTLLLLGGGAAGFVIGRYWHLLFGRKEKHVGEP